MKTTIWFTVIARTLVDGVEVVKNFGSFLDRDNAQELLIALYDDYDAVGIITEETTEIL